MVKVVVLNYFREEQEAERCLKVKDLLYKRAENQIEKEKNNLPDELIVHRTQA